MSDVERVANEEQRESFMVGVVRRWSVLAGVLTALSYMLVRTLCDVFYAPLGLSPEEIGLDQAALLARAIGVLIFAIALFLAFIPLFAPRLVRSQEIGSEKEEPQRRSEREEAQRGSEEEEAQRSGPPSWVFAAAAVIGVGLGLLVGDVVAGFAGFSVAYVFIGAGVRLVAFSARLLQLDWRHASVARTTLTMATLVFVITIPTFSIVAVGDRQAVQDGRGLASLDRFFAPWEATVADITWIGAKPPPSQIADLGCGIYLGSASGTSYVFDPGQDKALRIPTNDVIVRSHASEDVVCEGGRLESRRSGG